MMRPVVSSSLVLALAAACGGGAAATPTTALPTTVASSTTTTTTSTTTTTTLPPTTTTTVPAVPVVGWEGEGVRSVAVSLEFEPEVATADLLYEVEEAMRVMGIEVTAGPADARLAFTIGGTGRTANYMNLGRCYTGARIAGTATLSRDGFEDLVVPVEGEVGTPSLIRDSECGEEEEDSPFAKAFAVPMVLVTSTLFGTASIPYLTFVLNRPFSGEIGQVLAASHAALGAFGAMDRSAVSTDDLYDFLAAGITSIVHAIPADGYIDPAARDYGEELLAVLLEYSEVDHGFEWDSLDRWWEWLDQWYLDLTGHYPGQEGSD